MNRTITKANPQQVDDIMNVIAAAKKIMRQSGNMHQWADNYPSTDVILHDIEIGGGYVVEDDGTIVAYFAFLPSPEPTYANIYEGNWIEDSCIALPVILMPTVFLRASWTSALPTTATSASTPIATIKLCSTSS